MDTRKLEALAEDWEPAARRKFSDAEAWSTQVRKEKMLDIHIMHCLECFSIHVIAATKAMHSPDAWLFSLVFRCLR